MSPNSATPLPCLVLAYAAIFTIVTLASPVTYRHNQSSPEGMANSALPQTDSEPSTDTCTAPQGNADMYGVGIRISIYIQLATTAIVQFGCPELAPAIRSMNTWLMFALAGATHSIANDWNPSIGAAGGMAYVTEPTVLAILGYGILAMMYLCSRWRSPKNSSGSPARTIIGRIKLLLPTMVLRLLGFGPSPVGYTISTAIAYQVASGWWNIRMFYVALEIIPKALAKDLRNKIGCWIEGSQIPLDDDATEYWYYNYGRVYPQHIASLLQVVTFCGVALWVVSTFSLLVGVVFTLRFIRWDRTTDSNWPSKMQIRWDYLTIFPMDEYKPQYVCRRAPMRSDEANINVKSSIRQACKNYNQDQLSYVKRQYTPCGRIHDNRPGDGSLDGQGLTTDPQSQLPTDTWNPTPTVNQSSNIPHTAPRIDPDHINHGTDEDGGRDNPHQRLTLPRDLDFALGGLMVFLGTIVFVEVLLRQWSIRGVNKVDSAGQVIAMIVAVGTLWSVVSHLVNGSRRKKLRAY